MLVKWAFCYVLTGKTNCTGQETIHGHHLNVQDNTGDQNDLLVPKPRGQRLHLLCLWGQGMLTMESHTEVRPLILLGFSNLD